MKILIVVLMLLVSNVSYGELKDDGNKLLRDCSDAIELMDGKQMEVRIGPVHCFGRLKGMKEMNRYYRYLLEHKNVKSWTMFCLPRAGVPATQSAQVVVKYLKAHPEKLHESSFPLILEAFREAFPCKVLIPS
jgi:hypothetical protein